MSALRQKAEAREARLRRVVREARHRVADLEREEEAARMDFEQACAAALRGEADDGEVAEAEGRMDAAAHELRRARAALSWLRAGLP